MKTNSVELPKAINKLFDMKGETYIPDVPDTILAVMPARIISEIENLNTGELDEYTANRPLWWLGYKACGIDGFNIDMQLSFQINNQTRYIPFADFGLGVGSTCAFNEVFLFPYPIPIDANTKFEMLNQCGSWKLTLFFSDR